MGWELSMAARREITKKYARAGETEKGRLLDELVHATGWTRDHARRAIRSANARKGAARPGTQTETAEVLLRRAAGVAESVGHHWRQLREVPGSRDD